MKRGVTKTERPAWYALREPGGKVRGAGQDLQALMNQVDSLGRMGQDVRVCRVVGTKYVEAYAAPFVKGVRGVYRGAYGG